MKIAILGGGITALSSAWFLQKKLQGKGSITLFEGSDRFGGWIQSERRDPFLFELGPRSCRVRGGESTLKLIDELDLQGEMLPPSEKATLRYTLQGEKLVPLPYSLRSFISSPLKWKFLRAALKEWRAPRRPSDRSDETVHAFISRRFGKTFAEELFDPLCLGIFASSSHTLSVDSCFPALVQIEQQHRSLIKGAFAPKRKEEDPWIRSWMKKGIFTFRGGMERLVERLVERLEGKITLKKESPVVAIEKGKGDSPLKLTLKSGESVHFDHILSTLPYPQTQTIAQLTTPTTHSSSVAVLNIGYSDQSKVKKSVSGFGYLVPTKEKNPLLGVVFDSDLFPSENRDALTLTAMVGGELHSEVLSWSDQVLKDFVLNELQSSLKINREPDALHISRATNAITQYRLGHQSWIAHLEREVVEKFGEQLTLAGSSYRGVSVNDCISQAALTSSCIKIKQ